MGQHNRSDCRCWVCIDLRHMLGMATLEEADVELLSRFMREEALYEIDTDHWSIELDVHKADVERMRSMIARVARQIALATKFLTQEEYDAMLASAEPVREIGREPADAADALGFTNGTPTSVPRSD